MASSLNIGNTVGTASATGNPRNKTALKPGHSLMDWIRLGNSGKDLTGTGGQRLEVTEEELARHQTQGDAWMAIRGHVYNVSAYMDFHPGGVDELMRGVGKDATILFDEVHKWVNYQSMLTKCHVGKLVETVSPARRSKDALSKSSKSSLLQADGFAIPSAPPPPPPSGFAVPSAPPAPPEDKSFAVPSAPPPEIEVTLSVPSTTNISQKPRFDWFQTSTEISLSVFTRLKDHMRQEDVLISCTDRHLSVKILRMPEEKCYIVDYNLQADISPDYKVRVSESTGKVDVVLTKATAGQWSKLGEATDKHDTLETTADAEMEYHDCEIADIKQITHDTNLYEVRLPTGYRMVIPLGHHIYVRGMVEGMEVVRAYTVVPPSLFKPEENGVDGKTFYLMVKLYSDGALTNSVFAPLKPGDTLTVSTTYGGDFVQNRLSSVSHLVLVAAGTGFTPMAGLIRYMLETSPQQACKEVLLLFFNKTEGDIFWREDLDNLATKHDKFSVKYILSNPSSEWTGPSGRINVPLMEESIPKPGEDKSILLCACGPTEFTNEAVRIAKEDFGYTDDMLHAFLA